MLIQALADKFSVEYKNMSPDASEEAAVAGLLCLNSDEKLGVKKQPAKTQLAAEVASKRKLSLSFILRVVRVHSFLVCCSAVHCSQL